MKIYLAGPLFTLPEVAFNKQLKSLLEEAGHQIFFPQETTSFADDADLTLSRLLDGLKKSDVVVANMDGADPDSGTCWECGYAYALRKPTILFRTDVRSRRQTAPYNVMMAASATVRLDGPFASVEKVTSAILPLLDSTTLGKAFGERQRRLASRAS